MVTRDDYRIDEKPTWCSGCGDYGILNALTYALVEHAIAPHELMIVTGIGCGSKLPQYMRVNGMHTLHGRPWPIAQGAKLANHSMRVVIVHGDGDGYGEGLGHFVHAVRRNPGVTELVQNNLIYGLTKGQFSPTSEKGWKTSTSPHGSTEAPAQPLALAITHGATFAGRGYPGELKHLRWLIGEALEHPGYALVDILQPCVTFNKPRTYDYYSERVYKLEDEPGYDPGNRPVAWERAQEWGDRIPIGIFYRATPGPTFEALDPVLKEGPPLVKRPLEKLTSAQVESLLAGLH
jgi:2-oxoglutarate ferredoxin oxidoreductase subunit beta